jgi:hypothetical protein
MPGHIEFEDAFCPPGSLAAAPRWVTYVLACTILCTTALGCLAGCGGQTGSSSPPVNPNPTPTATSLNPGSAFAGGAAFTITVTGASFVPSSIVQWNGHARVTTFGSSTSLQTAVTGADIAAAGTVMVNVATPAPGGGTSNGLTFTINQPVPVVTISPATAILAAGGQLQFNGQVANSQNLALTWTVNGIVGGGTTVGTISATGLYVAPTAQIDVTISAISQADASLSASANLSVLPPHVIAIRPTTALAEFFNRTTGNAFLPRGSNYIRLAAQTYPDGSVNISHSTFNVGLYNPAAADTSLNNMQAGGYNIVRVFLNGCCHDNALGNPAGGLSSAYLTNLVDFLERAKKHGIAAILTSDWVPIVGGYTDNYGACTQFSNYNTLNLCAGGVKAVSLFFRDLVQDLINAKAPLDAIFAYELRNEYFNDFNFPPLSSTSGMVTTADGQTYDMSSTTSRQQMMDNGLIYFTNQVRAEIVALDPTALVEVGFFVPQSPNPTRLGDPRVITVYPAMANSTADFVSIHPYPFVGGLTFAQYVQNFGFVGFQQQKPVMLEEFGVLESDYPDEATAASIAQDWQVQSCAYDVKGWSFWTWDTSNTEQVDGPFWPADLGAARIANALSPASRPDPCMN